MDVKEIIIKLIDERKINGEEAVCLLDALSGKEGSISNRLSNVLNEVKASSE